ncbi:MAG: hypothetical protein ACK55O_16020 [Phycisphaerales bacterium]|nr:hypothetical protein [Phycisphaeraceae bacterium]
MRVYLLVDIQSITPEFLEWDGSCRDLVFFAPSWDGVRALLLALAREFPRVKASAADGEALAPPIHDAAIAAAHRGYAHVSFHEGLGLLEHVQVFIDRQADGSPGVEVTLFPDHLRRTDSLREDFIEWAIRLQVLLQASRCSVNL